MVTKITIEASDTKDLIKRLDQIKDAIESNSIEDYALMDGSFQIGSSNLRVD